MVNIASSRLHAANPHFGTGGNKKAKQSEPQATTSSDKQAACQKSETACPRQVANQKMKEISQFFEKIGKRLQKFLKRVAKAFQKLISGEQPKSPIKAELNRFSKNVNRFAQSPELQKTMKETSHIITQSLPSLKKATEEEKQNLAAQAKLMQTDKGRKELISGRLGMPLIEAVTVSLLEELNKEVEKSTAKAFQEELMEMQTQLKAGKVPVFHSEEEEELYQHMLHRHQ